MKWAAILLIAACSNSKSDAPKQQPAATADDPWAKKEAPKADPKDPDLQKMIDLATGAPGSLEYPQADAVVALDRDDVTIKPDGTVVEHHKSIVKILDAQRGKEKFADVHIPFDSKRENLTVAIARTVNSDGKPHAVAPDEIGDIVPPRLADATIYSDVRERVVSFPAVDKGSVIELEYTRTTQPGPDAPMGGEEMLGQWDPVLERTVTITAPTGFDPKVAVVGTDLKPTEMDLSTGHSWVYKLEKQPDRHPEGSSPVDAIVLPRLVYSFQPSWARVLQPLAERFLKAAVPSPVPAAVKQQADQLCAGAKNDTEKAQRLFAFVAHDIRSVDLPLGWAGFEPHAPDVVLANRYADERDKVGLLLALASTQGLRGQPVAVRTSDVPVIESVPTIAQFDRLVAKLSVDGKDVWLAPSDEHAQYGIVFSGQDGLVLPFQPGGAELGKRPLLDPSTSIATTTATYTIAPNGDVDADMKGDHTGYFANVLISTLRPLKGEHLDQWFQEQAASMYPAGLSKKHATGDTMSTTGFTLAHDVALPGYVATQGTVRVFELPSLGVDFGMPQAGLTARKYPLHVGTPRTEQGDITVNVPSGWKVAYVPPKLEGTADGLAFTSECTAAGQSVKCHTQVKLDKLIVPVEKYGQYHDTLAKLHAYERRVILLTKA